MTVGIVTDSASSLPPELVAAHHITVVPMGLTVGGRAGHDGDFSLEEISAGLGEGVSTSGPSPGEVAEAVAAADRGEGVVVLTIAQPMSSTYDSARLAMKLAEGPVTVVDTGAAAGAQGLVVLAAARRAAEGASLAEVEQTSRQVAAQVRLVATLPTLEHLARGGRVPQAAAWAGRWLGVNPVFEFRSGHVRPLRPARSRDAAHDRLITLLDHTSRPGAELHLAVMHALDPASADHLLDQLGERYHPAEAWVGSFTSVMVAHTGPGLVGLAWWWGGAGEPAPAALPDG
ncbi:MAG TPA: DegV family protein [Acidimicrobiales bacterium]|nr:DegV family protein [Acidimicrobiales bacterium]